jgi:hypothetical protein
MAADMFVWSPIFGHDGKEATRSEVGEKVTANSLGVDKEEFDSLIAAGAVRSKKPPETQQFESPREFVIRQLNEAVEEARENAYAEMPDFMSEADIAQSQASETPTSKDAVEVSPK